MTASEIYNWVEIFLWSIMGVGFLTYAIVKRSKADWFIWLLAPAFLLFALSDYIEIQTGAWWKPIWLLLLKVTCTAVFIMAAIRHYRKTKDSESSRIAHK